MAGRNMYDIDPVQKEILLHRQARRQAVREKYLQEFHNPYRYAADLGGYVDDPAITRFEAVRLSTSRFWKPNAKNLGFFIMATLLPVAATAYMFRRLRGDQEHKLRTGQISYRDREYKFH